MATSINTGSITSTGIGSGLDVNSIITQLMAVEGQPLTLLQQRKSDLDTQVSAIGQLQSLTGAMRDAAQKLTSVSLWKSTVASSGNESAVKVTTDGNTPTGAYSVQVDSLAARQTIASRSFAASTDKLGEGTLTIELGSYTGEPTPTGFTPKAGATPVTVTIGPDDTSLESVRDKINAAGAGVTATIVKDASGARLALRSSATGAENGFRISAAETTDDGVATDGLSALAFDAAGGSSNMTRTESAANAKATVNGIAVESASNTLDGVSDGMTLTLLAETAAPVNVDVADDAEGVKTAIGTFVKAFNDLASYVRNQTKYDPDTKKGGPMQGDQTLLGLQTALRGVINQGSTASTKYERLADIGITMQTDGTLAIDSTKLDAAVDNRAELRKLFAADGATTASDGFMTRFAGLGAAELDSGGPLDTRNSSLQAMIKRNQDSQDAMQRRLDQTEARLRAQYQALDSSMAKLNGLSSYLTGQLTAIAKNS
ncbi:MAG: flagellar filament capping protein FliD [Rubrivivax sp.]